MDNLIVTMPQDLENLKLPDPRLVTEYKNLQSRTLWVDGAIDEYCLEYIRHILEWNKQDKDVDPKDRTKIKIMVHSPGGDLDVNNSLIDVIKLSKTPILGVNCGMAASAGCFIFMSCHERLALPQAYFLLHKGSSGNISGTFDQIVAYVNEYQRKINELAQFILDHSKIDEETLKDNLGGEWYMDVETALACGVCDKMVTSIDEII